MKIIDGYNKNKYLYHGIIVTKGWKFESNSNVWMCYDLNGFPIPCKECDLREYND